MLRGHVTARSWHELDALDPVVQMMDGGDAAGFLLPYDDVGRSLIGQGVGDGGEMGEAICADLTAEGFGEQGHGAWVAGLQPDLGIQGRAPMMDFGIEGQAGGGPEPAEVYLASVDENGLVQALGEGSTEITATIAAEQKTELIPDLLM